MEILTSMLRVTWPLIMWAHTTAVPLDSDVVYSVDSNPTITEGAGERDREG